MPFGCVNISFYGYTESNICLKACTRNITLTEYFSICIHTILYAFVNTSSIQVVGNDC
jgi:hypothetical protein